MHVHVHVHARVCMYAFASHCEEVAKYVFYESDWIALHCNFVQALPKTGITVFGSQLHTHLRGARVLTRHFRDDIELPELNRDDYYSHHYQEIRYLRHQVKVYPVI